ncbi:MAG TPA: hypothetical protein VGC17_08260 [Lactovum miscens]|uniref:hypothetical protein n=1 Tax=Lactovum miscens TaxID=190387 RepID=UPI002EDB9EA2
MKTHDTERKPTANELAGMAWWNGLTDAARSYWVQQAAHAGKGPNASVADAWAT